MQRFVPVVALVLMTGCAHAVWYEATDCEAGPCAKEDSRAPVDARRAEDTGVLVEEDTAPPPEDTAREEDSRPSTGDPCNDCLAASCSSEISACFADTTCTALNDCFATCVDDACASACYEKYPSAVYDTFVTCAMSSCTAACS